MEEASHATVIRSDRKLTSWEAVGLSHGVRGSCTHVKFVCMEVERTPAQAALQRWCFTEEVKGVKKINNNKKGVTSHHDPIRASGKTNWVWCEGLVLIQHGIAFKIMGSNILSKTKAKNTV